MNIVFDDKIVVKRNIIKNIYMIPTELKIINIFKNSKLRGWQTQKIKMGQYSHT